MTVYAAYGSNLDPKQMLQRAPHSPARGTGWLTGWRLGFGGEDRSFDGALATVVEDDASQVFVMLYDLSPADEARLDRWEGSELGLYKRIRVRVDTLDGQALAWIHVLDGYEGGLPSRRYVDIIADAAASAGAPDDYVAALRARPCR
ncbi:MAG: gamma-glutamylcyclotransferase [Streptosporangiales bacterium]|nr:gamma-glutamylcyclotransferase [Streptosporangiales bacterium]